MKPDLSADLGQVLRVVVDRPLGSVHPRFPNLVYGVNYSFLPGTVSGDGLEIDVYLVGWDAPLREADAEIAVVIVRADDGEDKLIGVPPGTIWTLKELQGAVEFQEQYFDSSFMPGATVILDDRTSDDRAT